MRAGSGNLTVQSLGACESLAVGPEGSQMTTKGWHSATQDTGNIENTSNMPARPFRQMEDWVHVYEKEGMKAEETSSSVP
jgi:hypothetical protein